MGGHARGVWGYALSENFEIQRLGNAISSVLQELFVIYAYHKLLLSTLSQQTNAH